MERHLWQKDKYINVDQNVNIRTRPSLLGSRLQINQCCKYNINICHELGGIYKLWTPNYSCYDQRQKYVMSTRCQSSGTVSGVHAWWTTICRHYSRQVFPVYCEDMADSSGSSSFSPATPGPQSSIDELVSWLLENPHFRDVLERTTRRTHRSPSLQAN